jgi:EAL domain-containing protein (putative c-di-GMP-specific phosphodiesterase class I)
MYHAKKKGKNNYQFFKNEMNMRAVERQSIEADLRRGIDRNELILHYQPKVNLKSGEIIGAEALIRWNHPNKGMIYPESFIEIAEDCGLIIPIGRQVLLQACRQTKEWLDNGMPKMTIAVNISALEFRHRDFLQYIRAVLHETGLDATHLQLEITESVLMRNVESSIAILRALKKMGVQLAVDDFGTGYSSLSYLNQFPIDTLKIDQSFVRDISVNKSNGVIVSAVISMGASLNQNVIAEGIETQEQLTFLNAQDCNEGQGHFFSCPVPAKAFSDFLLNKKLPAQSSPLSS